MRVTRFTLFAMALLLGTVVSTSLTPSPAGATSIGPRYYPTVCGNLTVTDGAGPWRIISWTSGPPARTSVRTMNLNRLGPNRATSIGINSNGGRFRVDWACASYVDGWSRSNSFWAQ